MLDLKKENTNSEENLEITEEENIAIHTMQDDLASSGKIFLENRQESVLKEGKGGSFEENKEETKSGQYFNPFIEKQAEKGGGKMTDPVGKKNFSSDNISNQQGPQITEEEGFSKKTIWFVVSLIIIGCSAVGGYYFWNNRQSAIDTNAKQNAVQKVQETEAQKAGNDEELKKIEPSTKYSYDKPNYLSVDTDNPSYENFKEIISKAFLEIKNSEINKPVEFIMTDSKNNPIAFPIFSAITKLKLSNELLKDLSDDFSVFVYQDSGNPRLVLSIKTIDEVKAGVMVKNEESKLPEELAPLFLDGISLPKEKVVFNDGIYKGTSIRYFNLTPDQLSAVDYAFKSPYMIIGTSRNSMSAVLDKLLDGGM